MASISTAANGLNGEEIRRLERDILLLMVVVEDLVEEGDADLGVETSELEVE